MGVPVLPRRVADEGTDYWRFCFGLPVDPAETKQKIGVYQSACAHFMGRTAHQAGMAGPCRRPTTRSPASCVSFWRSLMPLDLVDEFRRDLYPHVACEGTRLFDDDVPKSYRLDLVSSTAFSNETVGLQYRRHR